MLLSRQKFQKATTYIKMSHKPTNINAFGAINCTDSSEPRLINEHSIPRGLGVKYFIYIEKQSFQIIDCTNDASQ